MVVRTHAEIPAAAPREEPAPAPAAEASTASRSVLRNDYDDAQALRDRQLEQIAPALPRKGANVSRLDREQSMTVILEGPEEEILWSIARRIERGKLDLPTLPSTSMAVIDLSNNPAVEFNALVSKISTDPVLSSELLRTANSVLYASEEPVDTLHAAIVRIGLRALRSMIFSVSMRGTILRAGALAEYGEDVWRQAHSVATVARGIAPALGVDPEKAFLLGLLHDIGKIALLAMLSREMKDQRMCTAALVGRVFQAYHQEAGAAMARKWRLPAEFVSVAGCHHAWEENVDFRRSAALAHVAHHLDLALTLGDQEFWEESARLPALEFLAPQPEQRERILMLARQSHASHAGAPAA
jgi:putative nucleotidyltransferase with HDIG domain